MTRRSLVVAVVALAAALLGGAAVATSEPRLTAGGPTDVAGTEASATFTIADRSVRQVRYRDGGTLVYTFSLTNEGRLPVEVAGLADDQPVTRLFTYRDLSAHGGESTTVAPGSTAWFDLSLEMGGCESLSARAGSFVTAIRVRVERAGLLADDLSVTLPEEIHTGSAREAFCPSSTATSRPPG